MALPVSRKEFKDYCLRRLGYPVIDINVDEDQIQDRIDDALAYYRDYHYDGTEHLYLSYLVTATDIANRYITLPETVQSVTSIFSTAGNSNINGLFNIRYQMHLNDLFDFSNSASAAYVMAMRHVETLEEIFNGKKAIRYSRKMDKLFLDLDWASDVSAGLYIIVDCYGTIDPETYTDVYADAFLLRYAKALIKRQWGTNLSKFEGMQLPGGITFNGRAILQDANEEIQRLEDTMLSSQSLPVFDMVG